LGKRLERLGGELPAEAWASGLKVLLSAAGIDTTKAIHLQTRKGKPMF